MSRRKIKLMQITKIMAKWQKYSEKIKISKMQEEQSEVAK